MKKLHNKVALVSGGATMIGQKIAQALVDAGAQVAIADIDRGKGEQAASAFGAQAGYWHVDLRSDDSIAKAVGAVVAAFGGIDILVNVACSYVDDGPKSTRAQWLENLDVSLVGAAMMLQAVYPHLRARGGGCVVNFGSVSGKVAQSGRWLYPAAKAAVLQWTRSSAVDLAKDKIRVNSVSPGWTWSSVIEQLSNGDRAKADRVAASFHAMGRLGRPEEVAQAVLFLCSEDSSFITGADLAVDGGYSAMGPEQVEQQIARLTQ